MPAAIGMIARPSGGGAPPSGGPGPAPPPTRAPPPRPPPPALGQSVALRAEHEGDPAEAGHRLLEGYGIGRERQRHRGEAAR